MRILITFVAATMTIAISAPAQAFCGFYVARADTALFNQASQVVLHGSRVTGHGSRVTVTVTVPARSFALPRVAATIPPTL